MPPSVGVLATESYGSTGSFLISTDGGGSYPEYSAPGATTLTITNSSPNVTAFGGNYALRFDMYLFMGTGSSTEYSLFGINHDGAHTNWFRASSNGYTNSSYDGVFNAVEADASDAWAYLMLGAPTTNVPPWMPTIRASKSYTAFTQVFKSPPFSAGAGSGGSPANRISPGSGEVPTWADVELAQVGNLTTLRINHSVIYSYTNTTAATSGNIMLGYGDPYDSIGNSYGAIYDNVRVVQLIPPSIVSQPTSVITPAGQATNLIVVASGSTTGFTNYQWYLNGVAIAGATNATLPFSNPQPVNDGIYTVVVTDGLYPVTSSGASLLVIPAGISVGSGTGLRAGYWSNATSTAPFPAAPTLTRMDPTVYFNWGSGSPHPFISANNFTARWAGQVQALSSGADTYTFTTVTDDGVRLWVDGQLLIDSWVNQSSVAHSNTIVLTGTNKYDILMEYFEATGDAVAQLFWSNATTVGYSPIPQSQLYPAASVMPAVVVASPTNGASYSAPATVVLTPGITTNANVIQYVSFYTNGTLIGSVSNAPYEYTWSGLPTGSYGVSATLYYNTNWIVSSGTNTFTVTVSTPPTMGITNASDGTLHIGGTGAAGQTFILWQTPSLATTPILWTGVQTNTSPSGAYEFILTPSGNGALFYKVSGQ
jgi:hypothetical protein